MSSSVFKEVTSLDPDADKMNGNLVIVVKRDGSLAVDKQILQDLLTGKDQPNTAVSVVRVTSPTPSIEEEINEEKMKKREIAKKQLEDEIDSDIDDEEFEDALEKKMRDLEASGDENDAPHVSLCLENYYPPDEVKTFVANVLEQAGVDNPMSLIPINYDMQRYTIQNDHCYTNLTLTQPRVTLVKLDTTTHINKLDKDEAKVTRVKANKIVAPEPESGESDFENDSGEFFDASDSDPTDISFSEDDDEDDLDFTFGNKKTSKKTKHKHHRSLTKGITKSRNSNSFNAPDNDMIEVSQPDNNKETIGTKKRLSKAPKKILNAGSSSVVNVVQAKPKPTYIKPTPSDNLQNKQKISVQVRQVADIKPVQQIIQRRIPGANEAGKVVMHPKIVVQRREKFGEVNALFSTPDVIKKVQPSSSGLQQTSMKEFLHLTPSNMKMNKQISVHTHSSVSELALEQDKQLELLESIVKDDLNTPISASQSMMHGNAAIPTIVKMLENPSNDLMMGMIDQDTGLDLNIDGLPEDLLQHVAELAENKEIQAIIDKQVLNVQNLGMGGGTMVDLSGGISSNSQMMSPMNNVLVQDINRPKLNVVLTPQSGKRDQQGIKVLRRDGSLLILPPVEAPTTRGAKRRAQNTSDVSPANSGTSTPLSKLAKIDRSATSSLKDPDSRNSSRRSSLAKSEKDSASGKNSRRQSLANSVNAAAIDPEVDDLNSDGTWNSEDDPDRLWCICKTPHNNRFMICCDKCEEWFHGNCVNITKAMGREMEEQGIEWTCPSCKVKRNDRKSQSQQKLTKFFNKKIEDKDAAMGNIDKGLCVICQEKSARSGSIYCSDNCIQNHADKLPISKTAPAGNPPIKKLVKSNPERNIMKDKNDKVAVYEKETNKILSMSHAPTTTQLTQWLEEHPSYEAVRPGSTQAKILTTKSKQSQQSKDDLFSNPSKISTGLAVNAVSGKVADTQRKIIIDPKKNIVIQQSPVKVITKSVNVKTTPNPPTVLIKSRPSGTPPNKISPGFKKQSSTEKHSSSDRNDRSSKSKIDQERLNVRRTLKETIMQRMTEITNPNIQKMTADECEQLARETEQEMYIFFNKDLSSKYKTKYRSLKFNLSDVKNITLIEKICCKTISPKQLVELQSAALASDELAKWRENESKHQLEIITKAELDALAQGKSLIVKTHKGEELLENKLAQEMDEVSTADIVSAQQNKEDHSPLQSPSSSGLQRDRFDSFINKSISLNLSGGNTGLSPLSSPSITSTTTKTLDLKDRHHHSSSKSSKHKKHDRHKSSKDNKRSRERDDKKKHSTRDRSRDKDRKESKSGSDRGESSKDLKVKVKPTIKIEEKPFKAEDCNLIDKILGDQVKPKLPIQNSVKDEIPVKAEVKPPMKKEEILDYESISIDPIEVPKEVDVYNGSIYMAEVARFPITASLISGSADTFVKNMPDCLEVVGRINPSIVYDYLSKLKSLPGKELVLFRFGSPDEEAYDSLFAYFFTRKRLGVIKAIDGVKDFYIFPIEAKKPLPAVLLPINGPGFFDGEHKPDLLVGVAVKGVTDSKTRKVDSKKIPKQSSASKMADIINMVPRTVKQPVKSKLILGLPKTEDTKFSLPVTKGNDDDEPYSPEDSDDDSKTLASLVCPNTSADLEMQTILQRIKESEEAIAILSSKGEPEVTSAPMETDLDEPYSPSRPVTPPTTSSSTTEKPSMFDNISLPSNITEILASIKGKSTYGSSKMDVDDDTDEYVPTATTTSSSYRASAPTYPNFMSNPPQIPMPTALLNSLLDVDERMFVAPSTSGESKLAKMSEDELLKMIPDEEKIEPEVSAKKTKWDIQCPPPPGLEDDFPA